MAFSFYQECDIGNKNFLTDELMPQEPCAFYCVEDVNMPIKTITTEGSIVSSMIMRREWCAHPRADHFRYIIKPNAPCGGELEKCVVPFMQYRRL